MGDSIDDAPVPHEMAAIGKRDAGGPVSARIEEFLNDGLGHSLRWHPKS
jgi:hypothetical protein